MSDVRDDTEGSRRCPPVLEEHSLRLDIDAVSLLVSAPDTPLNPEGSGVCSVVNRATYSGEGLRTLRIELHCSTQGASFGGAPKFELTIPGWTGPKLAI